MVKEEPKLEDLDWEDDDYAMDVIDDSRIYFKELDHILDNLSALNDRSGQTKYYPSMADSGNDVVQIALPRTFKLCINACTRYHNQKNIPIGMTSQAQQNPNIRVLDPSKVMRIAAVHGMSIYEYKWGCEIESLLENNMMKCINCDKQAIRVQSLRDHSSYELRYPCKVTEKFKTLLNTWSEDVGIYSQTMCGLWVMLSLRTHNELKNWNSFIDMNTKPTLDTIEFKLDMLRKQQ